MYTQELFLSMFVLTPLILIPSFGYKKNPIYFIIGIQLSFYLAHNFYERYLYFDLYSIDDSISEKVKAIEAHRDIAFTYGIKSIFITFIYILIISILFWYIIKKKKKENQQILKNFLKSSVFYFLLCLGSLIDILMVNLPMNINWHLSVFSFFLFPLFLMKAIALKYPATKTQHKKTSNLTWGLLIFFILFYIYMKLYT